MTLGDPFLYFSAKYLSEPSCDPEGAAGFFFDSVIGLS